MSKDFGVGSVGMVWVYFRALEDAVKNLGMVEGRGSLLESIDLTLGTLNTWGRELASAGIGYYTYG